MGWKRTGTRLRREPKGYHYCDGCRKRLPWNADDLETRLFFHDAYSFEACQACSAKIIEAIKPLGFRIRYYKKGGM